MALFNFSMLMLFVTVVFFIPSSTSSRVYFPTDTQTIKNACSHTQFNTLCLLTLGADSRSASAPDYKTLASISGDACLAKLNKGENDITQLRNQEKDPAVSELLRQCYTEYAIGVTSYALSAQKFFAQKNYKEASSEFEFASRYPGFCEDKFRDNSPPLKSPLTNENQLVTTTCLIARDLIKDVV